MIDVAKNIMSLETAMIMSNNNPYFQPSNRNNLCHNHIMSAKSYAKFKNFDIVQWVMGNVYSYQSFSKISKYFANQQKSWK